MPSPAVRPRGRPRSVDVDEILDAVEAAGLTRFTVNGVAQALGIRAGTVYNYFAGHADVASAAGHRALTRLPLRHDGIHSWVEYLIVVNIHLRRLTSEVPGLTHYYLHGPHRPETVSVFDTQVDEVARRVRGNAGVTDAARDHAFTLAAFASTTTLNLLGGGDDQDDDVRRVLGAVLPALHGALDGKAPVGVSWQALRGAILHGPLTRDGDTTPTR